MDAQTPTPPTPVVWASDIEISDLYRTRLTRTLRHAMAEVEAVLGPCGVDTVLVGGTPEAALETLATHETDLQQAAGPQGGLWHSTATDTPMEVYQGACCTAHTRDNRKIVALWFPKSVLVWLNADPKVEKHDGYQKESYGLLAHEMGHAKAHFEAYAPYVDPNNAEFWANVADKDLYGTLILTMSAFALSEFGAIRAETVFMQKKYGAYAFARSRIEGMGKELASMEQAAMQVMARDDEAEDPEDAITAMSAISKRIGYSLGVLAGYAAANPTLESHKDDARALLDTLFAERPGILQAIATAQAALSARMALPTPHPPFHTDERLMEGFHDVIGCLFP